MSKEKILTIAILVLLVLMAIGRVVNSQTTVAAQRWEYSLLIWDTSESAAIWRVSTLYESLQDKFLVGPESVRGVWDAVTESDGGLADYMAVLGISGYELADATGLQNGDLIYTFKRPIPND